MLAEEVVVLVVQVGGGGSGGGSSGGRCAEERGREGEGCAERARSRAGHFGGRHCAGGGAGSGGGGERRRYRDIGISTAGAGIKDSADSGRRTDEASISIPPGSVVLIRTDCGGVRGEVRRFVVFLFYIRLID